MWSSVAWLQPERSDGASQWSLQSVAEVPLTAREPKSPSRLKRLMVHRIPRRSPAAPCPGSSPKCSRCRAMSACIGPQRSGQRLRLAYRGATRAARRAAERLGGQRDGRRPRFRSFGGVSHGRHAVVAAGELGTRLPPFPAARSGRWRPRRADCHWPGRPVGFQNSATGPDLGFYAARSYSLMRPPRTGRRLTRSWERSAMGWSSRGGRSWRLRWGRRPL